MRCQVFLLLLLATLVTVVFALQQIPGRRGPTSANVLGESSSPEVSAQARKSHALDPVSNPSESSRARMDRLELPAVEQGSETRGTQLSLPVCALPLPNTKLPAPKPPETSELLTLRTLAEQGDRTAQQDKALGRFLDSDPKTFSRSHYFLGYADVLARYGRPDSMHVSEGTLTWLYKQPGAELGFTFFDGFVVAAGGGRLPVEGIDAEP